MTWLPFACALLLNSKPAELPYCKLTRATLQPGLCTLHYPISTRSEACQKYFNQGLGYWYSYVWTESARSFETALQHDPQCAMAWWGLSRAMHEWSSVRDRLDPGRKQKAIEALKKAYELRAKTNYAEGQLIQARALEFGVAADAPKETPARREAARKVIDHLLLLHPEDEEAWVARALIASEGKLFGGTQASAPFYLMLTRLNPTHPGANHELLHQYESSERPSLGWLYSERFIASSPGIHHAWHMQGHLATRLGRWEKAAEGSLKATALQRTFNREHNVKPRQDHQWSHHLETCLVILTHQGRYREARAILDEMKSLKFETHDAFARLYLARKDYPALLKLADEVRTKDKQGAAYFAALAHLHLDAPAKAQAEVAILEDALDRKPTSSNKPDAKTDTKNAKPDAKATETKAKDGKPSAAPPPEVAKAAPGEARRGPRGDNKKLRYRVQETKGLLLCKTGQLEEGLALLQKAADASKNDYGQHAWGHGAYYMEVWGLAALRAGKHDVAEEAFLEALAHDPGSIKGALGLQVLCERQGKSAEARQYQSLAERIWQNAELRDFLAEQASVRKLKPQSSITTSAGR